MGHRNSIRALIPLALGCILFGTVFLFTDLNVGAIVRSLHAVPFASLAWFTALTLALVFISALKWKFVVRRQHSGLSTYAFFKHTLTGYSLNLFLPVFVSTVVVRSWAHRRVSGIVPAKNIGTTLWDQGFDLLVALCAAPFGLLFLAGRMDALQSIALCLLVWTVCCLLWSYSAMPLLRILGTMCGHLPFLGQKAQPLFEAAAKSSVVGRVEIAKLFCLSILRAAILLTRVAVLAEGLGFGRAWPAVVAAFPPIQAMGVISLTPGNLGIAEWGLVGLLSLAGISTTLAATYAIVRRLLNFTVTTAILGVVQLLELFLTPQRD